MSKTLKTRIPGQDDIELVSWYDQFASYYPNCEPLTKSWFVKNSLADWVYLDCGANIGYYSILFSRLSPDGWVHAIEPTNTVDMLFDNLQHNHVKNVTVHQLAVGASSGETVDDIFRIWGQVAEKQSYPFITVDDFVASQKLTRLDAIKIDVDSYDYEVLLGSKETLEKFNPWVVVELNHALIKRNHTKEQAFVYMQSLGYRECMHIAEDNYLFKQGVKLQGSEIINLMEFQ